jgi:hypothetical protein
MKCLKCGEDIPKHVRACVVCGADAGFPNVRAAMRGEEVSALENRVKEVTDDATLRGCDSILKIFCDAVAKSEAVINRSLGKLNEIVSSDNELYQTFYQAIGSGSRLPEDNKWDSIRQSVDSLLFPYYFEQIRFGSLSIDRTGILDYGDYCIVLKETTIKDRATVFEENAIKFMENHKVVITSPLPLGFKATWTNRSMLAIAKIGKKLNKATKECEFPKLLASSDASNSDFIEVHIYGDIHRRAIEHLGGIEPSHKVDKVLLRSITKKLKDIGASVEIH